MMTDADLILCELLVLRCQRRDGRAADELVTFFEKPLLYYLRRMVGSGADAWDLVQETWVSVFRALPTLRDTRALPAFLYRTARNHALALLRHRNADLRLYASVEAPSKDTDHEPDFTPDDAAAVHAGLNKLSLPHREALTLFFLLIPMATWILYILRRGAEPLRAMQSMSKADDTVVDDQQFEKPVDHQPTNGAFMGHHIEAVHVKLGGRRTVEPLAIK